VTGGFEMLPVCNIATPGNVLGTVCFHGTLHVTALPVQAATATPTTAPAVATPVAPKPPAAGNSGVVDGGGGTSQPVVLLVGIVTAGLVLAGGRLVSRRRAR
jgi:hypothetical protein